jgi:hypothetical protein
MEQVQDHVKPAPGVLFTWIKLTERQVTERVLSALPYTVMIHSANIKLWVRIMKFPILSFSPFSFFLFLTFSVVCLQIPYYIFLLGRKLKCYANINNMRFEFSTSMNEVTIF